MPGPAAADLRGRGQPSGSTPSSDRPARPPPLSQKLHRLRGLEPVQVVRQGVARSVPGEDVLGTLAEQLRAQGCEQGRRPLTLAIAAALIDCQDGDPKTEPHWEQRRSSVGLSCCCRDRPGPWPPRRPRSPPPPSPQASTCPYRASSVLDLLQVQRGVLRPAAGTEPPRGAVHPSGRREAVHALDRAQVEPHFAQRARRIPIGRLQGLRSSATLASVSRPSSRADPPPPPPWPSPPCRPPAAHSAGPQLAAHLDRRRRRRRRRLSPFMELASVRGLPLSNTPTHHEGGAGALVWSAGVVDCGDSGRGDVLGRLSREPRWIGRPSPHAPDADRCSATTSTAIAGRRALPAQSLVFQKRNQGPCRDERRVITM